MTLYNIEIRFIEICLSVFFMKVWEIDPSQYNLSFEARAVYLEIAYDSQIVLETFYYFRTRVKV